MRQSYVRRSRAVRTKRRLKRSGWHPQGGRYRYSVDSAQGASQAQRIEQQHRVVDAVRSTAHDQRCPPALLGRERDHRADIVVGLLHDRSSLR
jgi:hypothetical protein